jgi:hypothetical protein
MKFNLPEKVISVVKWDFVSYFDSTANDKSGCLTGLFRLVSLGVLIKMPAHHSKFRGLLFPHSYFTNPPRKNARNAFLGLQLLSFLTQNPKVSRTTVPRL